MELILRSDYIYFAEGRILYERRKPAGRAQDAQDALGGLGRSIDTAKTRRGLRGALCGPFGLRGALRLRGVDEALERVRRCAMGAPVCLAEPEARGAAPVGRFEAVWNLTVRHRSCKALAVLKGWAV